MNAIVGDLLAGTGNRGSDQYQFTDFRHFDNAPTPNDVCKRANDAWLYFNTFLRINVRPENPPEWDRIDATRSIQALSAFGALTHSLQDFYSHSNWVELHVENGQSPGLIDGLFPSPCNQTGWPSALQTGYFDLRHGIDGCPGTTPPPGFAYCHEFLNKDNDASKQGGRPVPGMAGTTYHQLAMQLAQAHTAKLYQQVVANLKSELTQAYPQVRSDCLIAHLFQGSNQACRFGRLSLVNDSPSIVLGSGSLDVISPSGQLVATHQVQSWPPPPIQTSTCLQGHTIRYDIRVEDPYPPPTPRRIQGQAQVVGSACDGVAHVEPRAKLRYLVRFINADTKLPAYTNVVPVVNGVQIAGTGVIPAGTVAWIDLGPCPGVNTIDFILQFIDLYTGALRTATPDPAQPPFLATAVCEDDFKYNLGGQLYQ